MIFAFYRLFRNFTVADREYAGRNLSSGDDNEQLDE